MAANTAPIFSIAGDIGQSMLLTTAANDYTGVSVNNKQVFEANATNGGFLQKIRFKARGANVATVARIYINRGVDNTNFATAPAAPTGTPSGTGGSMLPGAYFATVIAIGPGGSQSVIGTYSASVTVVSATAIGSIAWAWTAVPGATKYRLYVTYAGAATGTALNYFESVTNSYTQTLNPGEGTLDDPATGAQFLYGEVSLPLISAVSATAAFSDIDYPMNLALPAGYHVYVGLGTTVAAGWQVTGIGGTY